MNVKVWIEWSTFEDKFFMSAHGVVELPNAYAVDGPPSPVKASVTYDPETMKARSTFKCSHAAVVEAVVEYHMKRAYHFERMWAGRKRGTTEEVILGRRVEATVERQAVDCWAAYREFKAGKRCGFLVNLKGV